MKPYTPEEFQPDGGVSLPGLPILASALFASAIALGWFASFVSQWFYLILIFPFAIGVGLVIVGSAVNTYGKLRNIGLAALLGLMASAIAMLSMHFFDYQRFLSTREAEIASYPRQVQQAVRVRLGNVNSFPAYMNHAAKEGVELSFRSSSGFNLGYVGTWIYWIAEFLAVAAMATFGMMAGVASPFCTACNSWKKDQQLGLLDSRGVNVAAYVKEGRIEKLRDHATEVEDGDLILTACVCPNCKDQQSITLKLEKKTKNDKGEEEKVELAHLTYPGEALVEVSSLFIQEVEEELRPRRRNEY